MKPTLSQEIEKMKQKLIRKGLHENFGLRELRQLQDKYDYYLGCDAQGEIDAFENWCWNYTGK